MKTSLFAPPRIQVVICFHDRDREGLRMLEVHLTPLSRQIDIWHRDKMVPGERSDEVLQSKLRNANLVILLVSADFNAEWDEKISTAMQPCPEGRSRVVPVLLRPCTWIGLPFYGLQPLPSDGTPLVSNGLVVEERFAMVAQALHELVEGIARSSQIASSIATAAPHTLVETLAQLERERHELELRAAQTVRKTLPTDDHVISSSPSIASDPGHGARTASSRPDSESEPGHLAAREEDVSAQPAQKSSLPLLPLQQRPLPPPQAPPRNAGPPRLISPPPRESTRLVASPGLVPPPPPLPDFYPPRADPTRRSASPPPPPRFVPPPPLPPSPDFWPPRADPTRRSASPLPPKFAPPPPPGFAPPPPVTAPYHSKDCCFFCEREVDKKQLVRGNIGSICKECILNLYLHHLAPNYTDF